MVSPLTIEERDKVKKILLRINKVKFTQAVIDKTCENLNRIRAGSVRLEDYFIPDCMTWDQYVYQWNLQTFVDLNST